MSNPEGVKYGNEYQHGWFLWRIPNENLNLIDVREEHEFQAGHAPGAKNLPLSTLEQGYKELKPDQEYHIICQGGVRSASACEFLSAQGLTVINVEVVWMLGPVK